MLRNSIWLPHLWLPGTIHMQPLPVSASSRGIHADTGVMGRMLGQRGASWCQRVAPPLEGGLYWIWSCQMSRSGSAVNWLTAMTMAGV